MQRSNRTAHKHVPFVLFMLVVVYILQEYSTAVYYHLLFQVVFTQFEFSQQEVLPPDALRVALSVSCGA